VRYAGKTIWSSTTNSTPNGRALARLARERAANRSRPGLRWAAKGARDYLRSGWETVTDRLELHMPGIRRARVSERSSCGTPRWGIVFRWIVYSVDRRGRMRGKRWEQRGKQVRPSEACSGTDRDVCAQAARSRGGSNRIAPVSLPIPAWPALWWAHVAARRIAKRYGSQSVLDERDLGTCPTGGAPRGGSPAEWRGKSDHPPPSFAGGSWEQDRGKRFALPARARVFGLHPAACWARDAGRWTLLAAGAGTAFADPPPRGRGGRREGARSTRARHGLPPRSPSSRRSSKGTRRSAEEMGITAGATIPTRARPRRFCFFFLFFFFLAPGGGLGVRHRRTSGCGRGRALGAAGRMRVALRRAAPPFRRSDCPFLGRGRQLHDSRPDVGSRSSWAGRNPGRSSWSHTTATSFDSP